MNITLEPRLAFQKNQDHSKEYRALVDSDVFKEGVHNAIAEFVLKFHPTTEELQGVNRFLPVLLNIAEKEEPLPLKPFITSIAEATKPQPKK